MNTALDQHATPSPPFASAIAPDNTAIAEALRHVAELLEAQSASPFRVRAWRNAARALAESREPVASLVARSGLEGLAALPGVGPSLAGAIREIVRTGHLGTLDRLRGELSPERLFAMLPGIGATFAHRVHEKLGIETLEQLEQAAHDARLETLAGFGRRRVQGVRELLAARLGRFPRPPTTAPFDPPAVNLLLSVDAEYRSRAEAGTVRRIAPRRFNPSGEAWLPILHLERDGWAFTVLYSNTAQAHALGRTLDWVVIHYERDGHEGQATVVTEMRGPHRGQRVVRGRELALGEAHEQAGLLAT